MSKYPPHLWDDLLDELIERKGFQSDTQLAEALGVNKTFISLVRTGRKNASLAMVRDVLAQLNRPHDLPLYKDRFLPPSVRDALERDQAIRERVINRTKGLCQLCGENAPFTGPDGWPFLEVYQIREKREDHPDSIDHLVGLCPNCRAKMDVNPSDDDWAKLGRPVNP